MKKRLLLSVLSVFAVAPVAAQSIIKTDFEIRSRGELRSGFQEPLADTLSPAWVNNLRTRINLSYSSPKVAAKVSLFDTRTLGSTEPGRTGGNTGVLEAWGEYRFTPQFSLSIGRRALEYDDKRIFSYNDWSNTPAAHDILLLRYDSPAWSIHLGSAWNNAADVNFEGVTPYTLTYKTLNFVRAERALGPLSLSALWVGDSYQSGAEGDVTTSRRHTTGLNLWLTDKAAPATFQLTGYYQFGRDRSDRRLNASLLAFNVRQKLGGTYSLRLGGDLYSGSAADLEAGKSHTFNKLYGSNHAFNGSIEYWRTPPVQGLVDIYAGIAARFSPKFNLDLAYHYFATARQIDTEAGSSLGSEVDLTASYTVSDLLNVQGGWSGYFTTRGSDILKQKTGIVTRFPQWAYIQLTFKIK